MTTETLIQARREGWTDHRTYSWIAYKGDRARCYHCRKEGPLGESFIARHAGCRPAGASDNSHQEPEVTSRACPIPQCGVAIPSRYLMCRKHWSTVPKALQNDVWRHYRPGQERLDGPQPTAAYYAAMKAAIGATRL